MDTQFDFETTLKDATEEELRNFILETLLELLDLTALLQQKKKPNIHGLH